MRPRFGVLKDGSIKPVRVIKMNTKKHYESYWTSKKGLETFEGYERNLHLKSLFEKGQKVLDLGCGDGAVSYFLEKNLGINVICADISKDAIKKAGKRGLNTILLNIEEDELPFKNNTFDAVFWGDNVEHLFDPEKTLGEIKRVLKRGGSLILSCPNMGYWRYRFNFLLRGELSDTEWTGLPPWAWSHIRFFNPQILMRFLLSKGFSATRLIGVNRRFPDKILAKYFPSLFGMILIVKAKVAFR